MSAPATVFVHVQLPTVKPSDPRYSDTSSWVWVPCLEFPVERVNELRFSSKPLKWIRYCTGAVTGTQGHLSRSADLLDAVDYDRPLPLADESMQLYYHVSDAEKELMFPIDPHLADPPKTNSVHSLAATTTSSVSCETFHQDLRDRDARCLIIGSDEVFCEAVHLVPHCRDDDYIRTLTTRRCRGREEDIVSSIDDVRNGLLIRACFHQIIRQTLAFMPTPNFAMDSSDAIPGADPSERMHIIHRFQPCNMKSFNISGTRLAIPSDSDPTQYPPPALFDAVYGAVVLHEFGAPAARARVAALWEDLYYPRGGFDATAAETDGRRRRGRAERAEARAREVLAAPPDPMDSLTLFPYLGIPLDEARRYFAEQRRRAEEEERRGVKEKVSRWREDVA